MKAARVFQLTALALVVVSAVQVGWWLYDQHAYTVEKVRAARVAYAEQTAAAQALLDAGAHHRGRTPLPPVCLGGRILPAGAGGLHSSHCARTARGSSRA